MNDRVWYKLKHNIDVNDICLIVGRNFISLHCIGTKFEVGLIISSATSQEDILDRVDTIFYFLDDPSLISESKAASDHYVMIGISKEDITYYSESGRFKVYYPLIEENFDKNKLVNMITDMTNKSKSNVTSIK